MPPENETIVQPKLITSDQADFVRDSKNFFVFECQGNIVGKVYVPKECFPDGKPPRIVNVHIETEA